ncbi:hypothetical protein EVAR_99652_1 [Eumeta japonica]|uniref:Uncharacterized protein n=1 Tax=Eumeta variegata TaxID=151549 RepID=A0A4C1ZLV6_EUMVA|nr:hypothetical protein EVAR_99652_1 [Eumeta japonica]
MLGPQVGIRRSSVEPFWTHLYVRIREVDILNRPSLRIGPVRRGIDLIDLKPLIRHCHRTLPSPRSECRRPATAPPSSAPRRPATALIALRLLSPTSPTLFTLGPFAPPHYRIMPLITIYHSSNHGHCGFSFDPKPRFISNDFGTHTETRARAHAHINI